MSFFSSTPARDYSLKTADIEGARSKYIEKKEFISRLKLGETSITPQPPQSSGYSLNEVKKLRSDLNNLQQQVTSISQTLQKPSQQKPQSHSHHNPNSPTNINNIFTYSDQLNNKIAPAIGVKSPNHLSSNGIGGQKINFYRNVGSPLLNNYNNYNNSNNSNNNSHSNNMMMNSSYFLDRKRSQGNIQLPIAPTNRITSNRQIYPSSPKNLAKFENHSPLPALHVRRQTYNNFPTSRGSEHFPERKFSPPLKSPHAQDVHQMYRLQSNYGANQISISQGSLQKYRRRHYVPPQKNEFSRYSAKQVLFY